MRQPVERIAGFIHRDTVGQIAPAYALGCIGDDRHSLANEARKRNGTEAGKREAQQHRGGECLLAALAQAHFVFHHLARQQMIPIWQRRRGQADKVSLARSAAEQADQPPAFMVFDRWRPMIDIAGGDRSVGRSERDDSVAATRGLQPFGHRCCDG